MEFTLKYRAEIDGLRAVSIIPVVLCHAGFEFFNGGFVGVDIFFVISGYLITTILIGDLNNNQFSLLNFYERRARRILPALFFMVFICIPFAWMWMLPYQMKDFSQSIVAVSLFSSNILFWIESGYFATASAEKPLLHTWSLAVEEQYYVIFPLVLFIVWRFARNHVLMIIIFMALVSLMLSEWSSRNAINANFYLAHTRAWELFVGSIAAFVVEKKGLKSNNVLSLLGLAAIIFTIFYYDETIPFPSIYSLLPIIGVLLIILYGDQKTFTSKLLGSKILVGIGLISYSAYLLHQPIFAFARIRLFEEPDATKMLALSILSFLAATLSWHYIEKPFRSKQIINQKQLLFSSFFAVLILCGIGLLGHYQIFKVKNHEFRKYLTTIEAPTKFIQPCGFKKSNLNNHCAIIGDVTKKPTSLILGDSHASALKASLAKSFREVNKSAYIIGYNGCTPIRNLTVMNEMNRCLTLSDILYQNILKNIEFQNIIVAARWTANYTGTPFDNGEGGIEKWEPPFNKFELAARIDGDMVIEKEDINNTLKKELFFLSKNTNLILVYPIPEAGWRIPNKLNSLILDGILHNKDLSTSYEKNIDRNKLINVIFDSFNFKHKKVRPANLFCDTFILQRCATQINGRPLYYDDDHVSRIGADIIVEDIFNNVN